MPDAKHNATWFVLNRISVIFSGINKNMNKPFNSAKVGIVTGMILFAALSRLLPHPHNFTPIGAIALFGAAYFSQKHLSILIPFAALWLSDLILNNLVYAQLYPELYPGFVWFGSGWVYAGFLLIALLGMRTLRQLHTLRILGTTVAASLIFYLLTNFGVWLNSPYYPQNIGGLLTSYAAGLPFFCNTLAGDLVYTGVLFGSFALLQRRVPALSH